MDRVMKALPNDHYVIEDTPLTRKARRYEAVVAADKIFPWFSYDVASTSSSDSNESE